MPLLGRRLNRKQMEDTVILRNREDKYMLNQSIYIYKIILGERRMKTYLNGLI
jgi:hypothetical protein